MLQTGLFRVLHNKVGGASFVLHARTISIGLNRVQFSTAIQNLGLLNFRLSEKAVYKYLEF